MTRAADQPRRVLILGSTGSIGTQTLDVIDHLNALHAEGEFPRAHKVVGLAAGRNADALAEQARAHPSARLAAMLPCNTRCDEKRASTEQLGHLVLCKSQ